MKIELRNGMVIENNTDREAHPQFIDLCMERSPSPDGHRVLTYLELLELRDAITCIINVIRDRSNHDV